MKRRNFLIGAGAASIGGSALLGTQAFSTLESHRSITVQVAEDPNAYLGMKPLDTPNSNNYVGLDDQGHLEIDISEHDDFEADPDGAAPGQGVNSDSTTWLDGLFELCNQGKEGACISYALPEGVVENDVEEQTVTFYYVDRDEEGAVTNRRMIEEGEEILLDLGECAEVGVRTVTKGISADDTPLVDGEVTVIADVDGDCFGDSGPGTCTPECPSPTNPDPGTDDFGVTIETINKSAFPTVEVTTRVDTTAGGNGNIPDDNFSIDESTPNGLGSGFCGQTIERVTFGGEQEETLADIMFVIDTSGSMGGSKIDSAKGGAIELIGGDTDLSDDANDGGFDPTVDVGAVEFASSATLVEPLGTDQNTVESSIDALSAGGGTTLGAGIREANEQFFLDPNDQSPDFSLGPNNRSGVPDFMIVLGNGDTSGGKDPADDAKNNGVTIFGIAYGSGASVSDFSEISGEEPSDPDYEDFTFDADQDDITEIFGQIGEEIFGTYTIEYETANCEEDGLDRNVEVYVDDPNEGDADATGSYTAPSS